MTKNSPRFSKKYLAIVTVLLAVILAGGFYLLKHKSAHQTTPDSANSADSQKLDLSPATAEEKNQAQDAKNAIVKRDEEGAQQSTTSPRTVSPTIIDAGQYDGNIEVRAYISSVYEDGGTCTFTFTKDSQKVTKSTLGVKDATTTRCTNLSVSKSEFSPGTWSVIVSYSSSAASGSSSVKTFEVN